MEWYAPSTGKRGRQRKFSAAAIEVCLTVKVLFGMPLRQTTGFVESVLRLAGLDWKLPDFSTLCRRQSEMGPWPQWGRVSPSNAGREHPISRDQGATAPADRQHRDRHCA